MRMNRRAYGKAIEKARHDAKQQGIAMVICRAPYGKYFVKAEGDVEDLLNRDHNIVSLRTVLPPPTERSLW